jgi:DNA-binding MarR family transcriptional regulator
MDEFSQQFHEILLKVYYNILRQEEQMLQRSTGGQVSIHEIHMMDCIASAGEAGISNSAIANRLNITRPSVTAGVNRLVRKGLVSKTSDQADGRQVRVTLTEKGNALEAQHQRYHNEMVRQVAEAFDDRERDCLLRAIRTLNQFFEREVESEP